MVDNNEVKRREGRLQISKCKCKQLGHVNVFVNVFDKIRIDIKEENVKEPKESLHLLSLFCLSFIYLSSSSSSSSFAFLSFFWVSKHSIQCYFINRRVGYY